MIEVHNLSKRYGTFTAVNDVSFQVPQDEVLGFLGPNGAGKTTIMKILTGFHFPTSGEALIDGVSVQDDPVSVRQKIGYLPELAPLYADMTVEEYLGFVARSRCIPAGERKGAVDKAMDACGLSRMRYRKIESLSKGYKQRTGLAQAIIHDPPILILDEPTTGLDPNQIIEIRNLIKRLGESKTVILSTHILQEVEACCSKVLILNEGKIAAQGSPAEIAGTMKGGETWSLTLKSASDAFADAELEAALKEIQVENVKLNPPEDGATSNVRQLSFFIEGSDNATPERIFDWATGRGWKIFEMSRKRLSLEDIFVKLTKEAK
jgi:ABC-2 type transport system ATP-binding protein